MAADEVYGSDSKFRNLLEKRALNYVVTISCQQRLFLNDIHGRVDEHVQAMKKSAWKKLSCGQGTKGDRVYEWSFVPFGILTDDGKRKGLLVRRAVKDKTDIAYYFTLAPARTRLQNLVNVAGSRWAIEECFEQSKQETGLDEYEVRSWHAWYRHITLSMFAHAMLSVLHFLPPYCPQHNRIERVWKDLHANVTRNHTCKSIEELTNRVSIYIESRNQKIQTIPT